MRTTPKSEIKILRGITNVYLVMNRRCAFLVDTGNSKNAPRVVRFLHENLAGLEDLKLIIVTHSHHDHVGSLAEVKKHTGTKVLLHEREATFLRTGIPSFPRGTNIAAQTVTWVSNAFLSKACSYKPLEPEVLITGDVDLSEYGMNASILCTPGHTSGSICVVVDGDKALVGDTVFGLFPDIVYPPWADDVGKLVDSWKRLLDRGCSVFYPAHGFPLPFDRLLREFEQRAKRLA